MLAMLAPQWLTDHAVHAEVLFIKFKGIYQLRDDGLLLVLAL